jgi:hypothetical protein
MFVFYIFYDNYKSFIARLQLAYEKEFEDLRCSYQKKLQKEKDYLFKI